VLRVVIVCAHVFLLCTVTNISPMLELSHLKDLFECCGPITKTDFQKDDVSSVLKITFKEAGHAAAAVFLNNTPLGDRPLHVRMDNDKNVVVPTNVLLGPSAVPTPVTVPTIPVVPLAAAPAASSAAMSSVPLTPLVDPSNAAIAAYAGTPIGDVLQHNPQLANFLNPAVAASLQSMPANMIESHLKRADEVARTIYIGNLSTVLTEEHLKQYFAPCGEIMYTKIAGSSWLTRRHIPVVNLFRAP